MNKHGHPSAQQHKRKLGKQQRRQHRNDVRTGQSKRREDRRTAAFRAQGLSKIRTATAALLAGAKAAGVDIQPDDVHGKFNSLGQGELVVSDRVPRADAQKAARYARELIAPTEMVTPTVVPAEITGVMLAGEPDAPRPWCAKLKGEWLQTAKGARRCWESREAAEKALQRATLGGIG